MGIFREKIINPLEDFDWTDLTVAHRAIEGLLHELKNNRHWLREEFLNHSPAERFETAMSSREPTTHFKWLIFRDPRCLFEAWIHEYKGAELLRPGYAIVPHNHVYDFTSLILNGGFKHISYSISRDQVDPGLVNDCRVSDEFSITKDQVYTLGSDQIHSLTEIQPQTTTMVINSRSRKPFSEEFNLITRRIVRHYPLPSRVAESYPFIDYI